ncbi:MAG TPA: S8 family serine peptidase [Steroidobacteraceae bacterium]
MAEQKDGPGQASKSISSKKATQSSETEQLVTQDRAAQDWTSGSSERPASTSPADRTSATVVRRKQRYLIGFRSLPGMQQLTGDPFVERLAQMEGVKIIRRLQGPSSRKAASANVLQEALVALMDEQLGEALRQNAPPHVIVELDAPLGYSDMAVTEPTRWPHAVQAMPFPRLRRELRLRVLGDGDRPVANAIVNIYGLSFPIQAITDASGLASLQIDALNGFEVDAVYVRPAADHWERYIQNPALDPRSINIIRLTPLDRSVGRVPGERSYKWGQRLMKFDRVPTEWDGAGTKIGLIDSGCDSSHPTLRHIVRGADFTQDDEAQNWKMDELGQGTHCAGAIAASSTVTSDMVGCAPGAEMHIFKVVPGGYFSDLIDALDQCIDRRLDIVQIGVGGEQFSELVAQKITDLRLNGIACIAGVGNSGAAVQFPANVPGVLAVSAVGKIGEYPPDTRHARRALPQLIGFSGLYATNFSCWGSQVDVCGPGVAVISTVPGGGYAAWDGSAMAASHVAGFSALLLAHHPALQSIQPGAHGEERVSMLNDLLRTAAMPYVQADPNRVGAGLPDLQQVLGFLPASQLAYGSMGASASFSALQAPFAYSASPLSSPMYAILRLRAAGLWV